MRLNNLNESRVLHLSPEMLRDFERISRELTVDNPMRLELPDGKNATVVLDPREEGQRAQWAIEDGTLFLKIHKEDRDQIYALLVHEVTHYVDPSMLHSSSPGETGKDYWAHPVEFNALSSEIIHTLMRRLVELRSVSDDHAVMYLNQLHDALKWPREFGRWDFLPGGNIPAIIDWWADNPELWKTFKVRLYNAIQDELQIDRSEEDVSQRDFESIADLLGD